MRYEYRFCTSTFWKRERPVWDAALCLARPAAFSPPGSSDSLKAKLQTIIDHQSDFWNTSFSFALHNASTEIAVAGGRTLTTERSRRVRRPRPSARSSCSASSTRVSCSSTTRSRRHRQVPRAAQPCEKAPSYCEAQCVPYAHCYKNRLSVSCLGWPRNNQSTCSYCLRYLHCYTAGRSDVPPAVTPSSCGRTTTRSSA